MPWYGSHSYLNEYTTNLYGPIRPQCGPPFRRVTSFAVWRVVAPKGPPLRRAAH